MGVWLQQLAIVLRKDLVVAKRNYRSTIISVLVPVIFVLFLYVLQVAFESNERLSDIVRPVRSSQVTTITKVPKCFIGHSPSAPTCITIAFAPQTEPVVQDIMTTIVAQNDLTAADVLGFDTSADLNRFLYTNPNRTQAAFNFFLVRDGAKVVGARYAIQYNMSTSTFRGQTYDPVFRILLPMQKAADKGIMTTLLADRPVSVDYDYIAFTHPETLPMDAAAQYGPSFFFGALMFNFVIQLGRLVTEKELKLRSSMKQMGLRDSVYLTAAFVVVLLYNVVSAFALCFAGLAFQLKFFAKNDFALYFVLFFLFGLAMTPLVLLLATFVSRSRTATVLGFGVFLVGSIIQGFATIVFVESTAAYYRIPLSFLPFAIFAKGMGDLSSFSNTQDSPGMRWAQRTDNDPFFPMTTTYGWLLLDTAVFLVLSIYLDQVIPDDNGVCQPPYYFVLPSYWMPSLAKPPAVSKVNLESAHYQDVDDDVRDEMKAAMDPTNTAPFRMVNLQKTFYGYKYGFRRDPLKDFHAVRGVFLTIQPRTLFCLLGHNGAGKTTTINALTGLTRPTDGDAFIRGKSIRTSMSSVQKSMGVCPQYDILWAQMTAREHLRLFAGLKQVPADQVEDEIVERLKDVDLLTDADNLAGNFSGGMQRRLSVAIALIGNPEIVYLDEPTTGMDPISRRKVWNLIERVKHDRITILTTHSMEEADVLGDRIGIMHSGRFACIGNSLRLKQKFGSGYRITVRSNEKYHAQTKTLFEEQLKGSTLLSVEEGGQKFNIPRDRSDQLPEFFVLLEKKCNELGIEDIQLSLSTLEEVFLRIGGLGEQDDRVGEQSQAESEQALLNDGRNGKRHCARHKFKYAALLVLILILVIVSAAFKKPTDNNSVADLTVYEDDVSFTRLPSLVWAQLQSKSDVAKCSRGDSFSFFVNPGRSSSSNLIIEFQGGAICWDVSTCSSALGSDTFNASVNTDMTDPLKYQTISGIFRSSEDNPFREWTSVYIPLCTADPFLGQAVAFYDAGSEVYHWGGANFARVLQWLRNANLTPSKVLITGWQNGAIGASFHTQTISQIYPSADITLLTDNAFDFSSAENIGNASMSGIPVSKILGSAMDEWRQKAFQSWNVNPQTPWLPNVLTTSGSNASLWSTERVLLQLMRQQSLATQISIARFNSRDSSEVASFFLNVLIQSRAFAKALNDSGIPMADLYGQFVGGASTGGRSSSKLSLSIVVCPILKSLHNAARSAAQTSGFSYAGFLAEQSSSSVINRDLLYGATGKTSPSNEVQLIDWLKTYLGQKPLNLVQAFNTSCGSGSFI